MDDPNRLFVLGFIGGDPVHKDNAGALLDDLIATHLRFNKGMKVCFMLSIEPFSDTMIDLADYCLTHGYKLGLIGHEAAFAQTRVKPFLEDASGRIHRLRSDELLSNEIVNRIAAWSDPRLILLGDPNEDENTYLALTTATEKNVPVRSLLNGLDLVILESEQQESEMPRPEDFEDDDELEDEVPDFDDDDLVVGEGNEEDEPDDQALAEIEGEEEEWEQPEASDDTEVEGEDGEDEQLSEDEDESSESDVETEGDEVEPEEPEAEEPEGEEAPVPASKWTEGKLRKLYERDRDGFYEVAGEYGIRPGKGIKSANVIARILEEQDGGSTKKRAPAAKKRAPAKKAAAKRTAAKKRASTKAAAPKKAAPVRKRTQRTTTQSAPAPSKVSRRDVKVLLDLIDQSTKVLKQLLR